MELSRQRREGKTPQTPPRGRAETSDATTGNRNDISLDDTPPRKPHVEPTSATSTDHSTCSRDSPSTGEDFVIVRYVTLPRCITSRRVTFVGLGWRTINVLWSMRGTRPSHRSLNDDASALPLRSFRILRVRSSRRRTASSGGHPLPSKRQRPRRSTPYLLRR